MIEASSPVMSEGKGSPEGEGEKPLLKEGERIYGAVIQPSRDLDGDSGHGSNDGGNCYPKQEVFEPCPIVGLGLRSFESGHCHGGPRMI